MLLVVLGANARRNAPGEMGNYGVVSERMIRDAAHPRASDETICLALACSENGARILETSPTGQAGMHALTEGRGRVWQYRSMFSTRNPAVSDKDTRRYLPYRRFRPYTIPTPVYGANHSLERPIRVVFSLTEICGRSTCETRTQSKSASVVCCGGDRFSGERMNALVIECAIRPRVGMVETIWIVVVANGIGKRREIGGARARHMPCELDGGVVLFKTVAWKGRKMQR